MHEQHPFRKRMKRKFPLSELLGSPRSAGPNSCLFVFQLMSPCPRDCCWLELLPSSPHLAILNKVCNSHSTEKYYITAVNRHHPCEERIGFYINGGGGGEKKNLTGSSMTIQRRVDGSGFLIKISYSGDAMLYELEITAD